MLSLSLSLRSLVTPLPHLVVFRFFYERNRYHELFLRTHLFINTCVKYLSICFVLNSILDIWGNSENRVPVLMKLTF